MTRPSLSFDASPEAFAAAMVRCQMWGPDCSHIGECRLKGDCFRTEARTIVEARRAILAASEDASPGVADLMRDAANWLVGRHNEENEAVMS